MAKLDGRPASELEVEQFVADRLARGERIPGFGHPIHERDPRVEGLLAARLPDEDYRALSRKIEAVLVRLKGTRLLMNADAAVAALMLDAGLRADAIDLVTTIGRTVGLAAHVYEEIQNEAPFRAPSVEVIDYVGPAPGDS
jgi:citrate synthase